VEPCQRRYLKYLFLSSSSKTLSKTVMKSPKMKGMTLIVILMIAVVAAGALTVASVYINGSSTKTASLSGVLSIYVSGVYSGPDTNSASYNVTLNSKDGVGTLNLTQISGSSDLIANHNYSLSNVLVSPYNITMTVSGSNVSMGWINDSAVWTALNVSHTTSSEIANSVLWNDLNDSYAAASGPNAPANETIGGFSPSIFQLPTSYYIFIGVTIPNQPVDNIPFAIAPVMAVRTTAES
jgi:hypothetical protein